MKLYLTAREFYKEAVAQEKTRFVFDDDLYEMSCFVEPSNSAKLKLSSLVPLPVKYFPPICPRAAIDSEWREQSSVDVPKDLYQSPVEYWRFVLSIVTPSGRPRFVNLRQVIYFFFSLPFSNVVAECLFSTLKEVKTDKQNKLSTLTLSAILRTKCGTMRINVRSSSLIVDHELEKRLKEVRASATVEDCV